METKMIKVKSDTQKLLNSMKVVERESYDEVIKRLILSASDNEGSLKKATEKMILHRIEMKNEGKAVSINELLEKMKKIKKDGGKV